MILTIVTSVPPAAFSGVAKSIGVPLRSRPRESNKLLMYADAVLRLRDSMVVCSDSSCVRNILVAM